MNALPLFDPTGIHRVLCIVAHPDDMEYGGSAAVAQWTSLGIEVSYLLLTAGEAGIRDMHPERVAGLRAREQREACDLVGVSALTILDLPDGLVEHSVETRRRIAREIRLARPDAIITMTWKLEVGWGLNHSDHRATGLSVVDAIRDADNPWIYPEQLAAEGLKPWKTTWLLSMMHDPDHAIEVSPQAFERGVHSLEAHRAYLAALTDHPVPRELLTGALALDPGGERKSKHERNSNSNSNSNDEDVSATPPAPRYALPVHAYRMG